MSDTFVTGVTVVLPRLSRWPYKLYDTIDFKPGGEWVEGFIGMVNDDGTFEIRWTPDGQEEKEYTDGVKRSQMRPESYKRVNDRTARTYRLTPALGPLPNPSSEAFRTRLNSRVRSSREEATVRSFSASPSPHPFQLSTQLSHISRTWSPPRCWAWLPFPSSFGSTTTRPPPSG